jgi:slime mold repeat-containing protein
MQRLANLGWRRAALLVLLLATRSALAACGDGVLQSGETCDASAPGGDAACPGACISAGVDGECSCARPSIDTRRYVLIADTALRLGSGALVVGGNVGVVKPSGVLTIRSNVLLPSSTEATADQVRLSPGARLGRLFANAAAVPPGTVAARGGPFRFTLPLNVLAALPSFPSLIAGTNPVGVPALGTLVLEPGSYGTVTVGQGATLVLRGLSPGSGAGSYHIQSLRLGSNAQLIAYNPVVIEVVDRVLLGRAARLGPSTVVSMIAGDVQLEVGGRIFRLSRSSSVAAHVRAPNAKAMLGRGAFFTGRLIAASIVTANPVLVAEGACGDGLLQATEQCDTSAPQGDARCPGNCFAGDPEGRAQIASGDPGQCTCRCSSDADCTDGNACNGAETCQGGVCVAGLPPDCDDGNQCTRDCDPAVGCVNTPLANGTGCSDGDACTQSDTCQAGVCVGGAARNCNDGNPCTDDTCDPRTGCHHTPFPDGTPCVDGNACTYGEVCSIGKCVPGGTINCGDGNPCTDDTCDPALGCRHTPVEDGAACSDGNACTTADSCQHGACVGGPPPNCVDTNPCTADSCDAIAGCRHDPLPNGTSCGPGKTCQGGNCS